MSLPQIEGHELQDLIGAGSCGAVYRAVTSGGRACAVKVFSAMSINRRALAATMRHLQHMPQHQGVLEIHSYSFDQSPYFAVMPLVGMMAGDEHGRKIWQTPTLESLCGRVSVDKAWACIYEMADAIAWLHKHDTPHGNLRAANVLIDNDPAASVRIADAGQGWVGGTHHFELGDHWMHLCPDHIEEPEGVSTGQGATWDVYSFGVLAYRLLTGRYPRGAQYWAEQNQAAAKRAASGLTPEINGGALLAAIRHEARISWPAAVTSKWDERRREIITRALDLDPKTRWNDMREVVREFELLESDYLLEDAHERIEQEKLKQAGRVRRLQVTSGALLAGLCGAAALCVTGFTRWWKAESVIKANAAEYETQTHARDEKIGSLTADVAAVTRAKAQSDSNLKHSQQAVDQFLALLLETPAGSEMEAGFSRKQLEDALAFVQHSLPGLEKAPDLGPERVRAFGNIGRIYLQLHQPDDASEYLEKARAQATELIAASAGSAHLPEYHQWLGQYALLLSEVRTAAGKNDESLALLKEATGHLEQGLEADATNRLARFECARAWLESGTRCRMEGDGSEALAALAKVPALLDSKVIGADLLTEERFVIARSKFQRALAERDSGKVEESIATLIETAQEMGQLVMGSSPRNQDQALALAAAYTELAEIIGTHFSTADAKEAHNQAVPILLELNRLHPEWAEVKYLLARNYGAISSLERDAGNSAEATKKKQDAIEFINEVLADDKDNPRYNFLVAKLRGEYAELIADFGKAKDAVPVVKLGIATLEKLLEDHPVARATPEHKRWEIELARLYGVLGHSSESANEKALAKSSFTNAAERWEKLAAANAGDETIQQGLNWTKNRLAKLK